MSLTFQDLCEEIGVALVVKGRIAAQEDVGDDSDTPDIDGFAVRLLRQHFRRCCTYVTSNRYANYMPNNKFLKKGNVLF